MENGKYYSVLGLYTGNGKEHLDDGKENGNYYSILGVYMDNGKEHGNHYSMLGL